MSKKKTTITLSANARYGYGGKQFVCRIAGRDPKFTFRREFLGRKEGKRGESTTFVTDEPGLYQERDIDSKGRIDDTTYVVWMSPVTGGLVKTRIEHDEAMALARSLDEGEYDQALVAYLVADLEKVVAAQVGKNPDEMYDCKGSWGEVTPGQHRRGDVVTIRQALIARLRGEPEGVERVLDLQGGPTDPDARRKALAVERATLAARLAEIDAELGAAS